MSCTSASLQLKAEIHSLLFGDERNRDINNDDVSRWFNQGFDFCDKPSIGLRQRSGGPCGVLAATNAEIIKYIYFDIYSELELENELVVPDNEVMLVALAKSIQTILQRSSLSDSVYICLSEEVPNNCINLEMLDFETHLVPKGDECFEFIFNHITQYTSKSGCLLFVISLIMTRSVSSIRNDMDDANNSLVGRFGHTTQELINLLLTGRATSNVIDGEEVLGDSGLVLKGVNELSSIGYLTQLEAYGHCRVGDYYKYPEFPIWVVGSSSHFSLLFGVKLSVNDQSSTEKIIATLRRAFNNVDTDKCGFIPSSKLKEVLKTLQIELNGESNSQRLQNFLQVEGDIIIWGSFCEHLSKLLAGDALDKVIGSFKESGKRPRSDSEVARYFQEAFDNGVEPNLQSDLNNTVTERLRSDSEIARSMQAEFDNNEYIPITESPHNAMVPILKEYTLFYFNGLEGPNKAPSLTKFSITIEVNLDKVGSQVSLASSTVQGGGTHPIEEILKTRWPNCKVNWGGVQIPSID